MFVAAFGFYAVAFTASELLEPAVRSKVTNQSEIVFYGLLLY